MNMCQLVDNKDIIIGHKKRQEITLDDIYRTAGLWLTNSQEQVLIAQRHRDKDKHPNKWGPAAAGTLEDDETYESNIYKEAEEEIGLTGVVFEPGPKMLLKTPHQHFVQWFSGVCDRDEADFVLQPTEVQAVKWIDPQALASDIESNPSRYVPSLITVVHAYAR